MLRDDLFSAMQDLDKGVELDPGSAESLVARSLLHTYRGNQEQATKDLMKAREINPEVLSTDLGALYNDLLDEFGHPDVRK
jgi:Tfp pilus assembly protein PilF